MDVDIETAFYVALGLGVIPIIAGTSALLRSPITDIPAAAIPESEWTQLFIWRFTPEETADRTAREYRSTHPPDWVKRRP